jgi:hypothetical protein
VGVTARRYVTPWWSHALSALALLLIAGFVLGPRAVEILRTTGHVGWYAAATFVGLFLGIYRLFLALKLWRTRSAPPEAPLDV